jgi:inner membrane protein
MENVTHSLFGAALYYAGGRRLAPRTLPLWIIGANLPDIDVITQFMGRLIYIEHHRGLTHTGLALLPLTILLTLVWQCWAHYLRDANDPHRFGKTNNLAQTATAAKAINNTALISPPTSNNWLRVGCAALITIISHTSLDWLNNYGVRPGLPFSQQWFYGDLVFIADPWIWILLSGAILSQPQLSRAWQRFFAIFAALATLLVLGTTLLPIPALSNNLIPWPGKLLWIIAVIGLIFLRYWRQQHHDQFLTPLPDSAQPSAAQSSSVAQQSRRLAQLAIAAMAIYLIMLYLAQRQALPLAQRYLASQVNEPLRQVSLSPNLANPFNWQVFASSEHYFYRGKVSLLSTTALSRTAFPLTRYPLANQHPAVQQALQTAEGRVLQNFCRYLLTDVIEYPTYYRVILHDGRYSPDPEKPGFAYFVIDVPRTSDNPANGR